MEYQPHLTYEERRFFGLVGPRLERLAQEHNVKLEKWFKDDALWALVFRHPRGGTAHVVVGSGEDDRAELSSAWWFDDFESETRRLATGALRRVSIGEPLFEDAVLKEIRRVLGWTDGDLEPHKLPDGMWRKWFTKEAFEKLDESLPHPRV